MEFSQLEAPLHDDIFENAHKHQNIPSNGLKHSKTRFLLYRWDAKFPIRIHSKHGWADFANHISTGPPEFSDFPTVLRYD